MSASCRARGRATHGSSRLGLLVAGTIALALPVNEALRAAPGTRAEPGESAAGTRHVGGGALTALSDLLLPVAAAQETTRYTCPMHPHYIAEEPGTCPICGMDLVALQAEAAPSVPGVGGEHSRAAVTVAPETVQSMGVRTARAEPALFGRRIRAFGQVQPNMRSQSVVSSRVSGWIEGLAVTAEGDRVERGEVLYRVYSPELVGAQEDYLAAVKTGLRARVEAAGRRLRAFGLSRTEIDAIARRGSALEQMPVTADTGGVVSELAVRVGSFVKPGDTLLEIQDYDTVWLEVSVPEKHLPLVDERTQARVSFPKARIEPIDTQVDYVYPTVDDDSRTGRVRLLLDNPAGDLRPGAYADVELFVEPLRRLSVPSEAILRSKEGHHVILALGEGRFQPRAVTLGLVEGGRSEVLSGLEEGELVVVSGQFLIDSESALRESFRKLERAQAPLELIPLSDDELAMLDHLLDAALYVHEALVDGYDVEPGPLQVARDLQGPLEARLSGTRLGPILSAADAAVADLQAATTESALREGLGELVRILRPWVEEGRPERYRERGVHLLVDPATGEPWLQVGARPLNPHDPSASGTQLWPPPDAAATAAATAASD